MTISQFLDAFRAKGVPVQLIFEMPGGYSVVVDLESSVNGLCSCLFRLIVTNAQGEVPDWHPVFQFLFNCPSSSPLGTLPALCEEHLTSELCTDPSKVNSLVYGALGTGVESDLELLRYAQEASERVAPPLKQREA